jgi:hypothetical protein
MINHHHYAALTQFKWTSIQEFYCKLHEIYWVFLPPGTGHPTCLFSISKTSQNISHISPTVLTSVDLNSTIPDPFANISRLFSIPSSFDFPTMGRFLSLYWWGFCTISDIRLFECSRLMPRLESRNPDSLGRVEITVRTDSMETVHLCGICEGLGREVTGRIAQT